MIKNRSITGNATEEESNLGFAENLSFMAGVLKIHLDQSFWDFDFQKRVVKKPPEIDTHPT